MRDGNARVPPWRRVRPQLGTSLVRFPCPSLSEKRIDIFMGGREQARPRTNYALSFNSLMTKSLFSQTVLMARVMTRIAAFFFA